MDVCRCRPGKLPAVIRPSARVTGRAWRAGVSSGYGFSEPPGCAGRHRKHSVRQWLPGQTLPLAYSLRGRVGLAATVTAVAAVLGAGCGTAGPAGGEQSREGRAPSPAVTNTMVAPAGGAGGISAIAALSQSDAWGVGSHRPLRKGIYPLTEHWDGERWTAVPCPSPGSAAEPVRSYLTAAAIDAPNDSWAVGYWSPIEHAAPVYSLIEHWNGTKWSIVPAPRSPGRATGGLSAVAAISPTAAWAFEGGAVLRWDGSRWRYLPRPAGTGPGTNLSGMAVISARDIWVVGTRLMPHTVEKFRTLAEHWDGSKWTIVPTPNAFKGRTRNSFLSAVSGSSSGNVWAVGWYQSGPNGVDHSALIEHWDGSRWLVQPSPDARGSTAHSQLFAVAALSRTSAWATGSNYGPVPLIERWDGRRWTAMPSRLQSHPILTALDQIFAVDPRDILALGMPGLIEKWNGTTWQQVPDPNP
jgi:hypothetical protein